MSNTKKIVSLIREIVKQEVQKEVKKILISGPKYGIMFNIAQINAIAKKFSIPNINKSRK